MSISAEGTTTVRFRSVDNAGNTSAWSTVGGASTVKLDRTPPTVPAGVTGGSSAWSAAATKTVTASGGTDAGSGFGYQYETALNGGGWSASTAGASVAISAEGTTTVQFRTVDNAGNTSGWSTVAAAAPSSSIAHPRHLRPPPAGPELAEHGGDDGHRVGGGCGLRDRRDHLPVPHVHRRRHHLVGARLGQLGQHRRRGRDARAVPGKRQRRQRRRVGPAADTAGATVRLDRGLPTAPTVSGGSSAWTNAASVTLSATGSTDSGSGLLGYQSRTSANGGSSWSAWSATGAGSLAVSGTGTTLVEFRSVDKAPATRRPRRRPRTAPRTPSTSTAPCPRCRPRSAADRAHG